MGLTSIVSDTIWRELNIPETNNVVEIRRAYARRLKQVHPEDDPEGFQRLRTAYESAVSWAAWSEVASLETTIEDQTRGESSLDAPPVAPALEHSIGERAFDIVQKVMAIAAASPPHQIVKAVSSALKSEELENIELKSTVEELLIDELSRNGMKSSGLLEAVMIHFEWYEHHAFESEFSRKQILLDRLAGWRAYDKLRADSSLPRPETVTRLQARAAEMLVCAYDPWRFHRARFANPGLSRAVKNRIEILQLHAPLALEEHLDNRSVGWWMRTGRRIQSAVLSGIAVVGALLAIFLVNNDIAKPSGWWVILIPGLVVLGRVVWGRTSDIMEVLKKPRTPQSGYALAIPVLLLLLALVVLNTDQLTSLFSLIRRAAVPALVIWFFRRRRQP